MEDTVTYEQELEQQDPIPKPKKLKVKDFAAKIKAKYPDYKDMDDTELTNRIVKKYPEYKDQVDLTPETSKKKVGTIGLEESSLQAGNVLSQSGGVGGEEIPKVEKNDIDVALEYGKLKGATKWGATPSSGKAGEVFGEIPDEEKRKAANKLAQDFNKVDLEGLSQEFLDFPEAAFERETTSKEALLKLRKENPIQYAARLNNAKTVYKIAEKSDIATANRFNQLADIDYGSLDGFISGKQQQQDIINQTLTGVDKEKATARLKENASRFINSLNPDLVDEYENSDIKGIVDANQYAGLKTWEVFEPEKYKQAIAMLKEPIVPQYQYEINVTPEEKQKSITTDSALAAQYGGKLLQSTINQQIGKETILRQLNGQGLQNAAKDIQYRQYVLAQRNKTAKDDAEKFQIAQEYIQTENELAALTKSQKDEDAKYPYTAQLKFDQQVKDITLDRGASVGELMYNRYAHGIGSTVDAGEDLATTLFGSESDKAKLRNKRIGEQKVFEGSVYLPPNEQRINPEEIIVPSDELKKKVNGLLKGRSLNSLSEQERKKVNDLVAANQDQIETITNPEAGKSKNFFSKATALSVSSFTSDIAAFMTNMGMLKGVGLGGKLAEATTLFKDGYTEAFNKKINEGASINSANEYGLLHGGILALMAKFGSKYEAVQNILKGGKSPMAKKIAGMSEETWNNIYNENKGIISRLASSSKNVAKEQGKMIGTFGIAAPTLSSLADNAFYDQHKSVSQMASEAATSAEEMLVGSLGFIVAGLAKGAMKPKATPLEKAALWELGDNPELGKAKIDEAVKLNDLTKEDGERRKGTIDKVSKLIEKVPTKNDKNIPLTDNQKTNYLYNLLVKENAKDEAKSLPEKQAEVKEKEGLVADFNNQILLSNSTEKQLTNRKEELEKQLHEKDDKGKLIISDQDKIKVEAEIEAIDSHLDTTKKEVKEEELPDLSQPIPELNVDNKGIPIGENVPAEVKGEPEKITQPIELSVSTKPADVQTDKGKMEGSVTDKIEVNDVVVALPEKGFVISDVTLNKGEEKGKGSGQEIYKKALDEYGTLYSSFPISEDAMRVQNKLVEKGIAKIETITLSDGTEIRKITKIKPTDVVPSNPTVQEGKPTDVVVDEGVVDKAGSGGVGGEVVNSGLKLEGSPRDIIKELKSRKDDKAIHAEIFQKNGYNVFVYDNNKILVDKTFKTHEEAKKYLDDWSSENGKDNQSKYDYGTITDIANPPYRQEITGNLPKDFIEKNKAKEQPQAETKPIKNEEPQVKIPIPKEEGGITETKTGQGVPETAEPFVEEKRTILSHRGLQEVATEFGFGDVTSRELKTDPQLFKDAQTTVDKWSEKGEYSQKINGLVEKAENSEVLTDEQRVILQQHIANVRGEMSEIDINSPEYNTKLSELNRLIRAGERTRSAAGAALRVPFMASVPNDLPTMLVEEMNISRVPELTPEQKATVQKEYTDISTAEKVYQQKIEALEAENAKLRAGRKVAESKSTLQRTKKTSEDFAKEREDIKKSIADKWNKAKNVGIVADPKNDLLIQIAPDVAKLVKSYVEEGVSKLEDIVAKVHDELKGFIPDLKEKDIHNIIAGDYNKKLPTKNQIAEQIENIRIQAKLVNKLESLLAGEEPKNEKRKIQRNAEIESLRQQIKEFKKEKLTPDQQALKALKTKMQKESESLKEQLRTGDYGKPEKKEPIKLDAEALKMRDELIKLRQNREVRLLLAQRINETKGQRAMRLTAEVFNIPRTLMTIGDYSGLLRQNIFFSAGHPLMSAAASKEMFKAGWSQTMYDRWFADLKDSPRYPIIEKSRLAIADSLSHDLTKREENFMSSLSEKIPLIGKTIVKGSERSYTALLNKMRVDMFNYFADSMEARGLTYENSPKVYDAMAEYINNATGRSDFGETLNRVAPVLNAAFFSPRLIASRVNMLTYWAQPRFWKTLPREVRVDYFRNWISLLAVGGTLMAVAKMGGADVEDDPRSSDFGKIKSGNTRWDIWGGAQPYVRVVAQVATGKRKSTNTGKMYDLNGDDIFGETKSGVVADFFRNKLAPVPGAAIDVLSGRTGIGDKIVYQWGGAGEKEISLDQYVKQRLLPMTITGVQEAMKDQGTKALLTVGIPSTFGVGTQTYEKPAPKSKKPTKKTKPKKPEK